MTTMHCHMSENFGVYRSDFSIGFVLYAAAIIAIPYAAFFVGSAVGVRMFGGGQ